ncbi:MAG: response regulator transcription factor [Coriobacteriia bacterium]|nr:response regulator transcription factor [Coriobacteriia bacterium]MBN2823021.1 response regulator transcription factor [Coriobacteriia bacterium]
MVHMKTVLIASDDAHTAAWVRDALAALDVSLMPCSLGELKSKLVGVSVDLLVLDGGRSPAAVVQLVEQAAAEGNDLHLMLLVEPEALEDLRVPVHIPSDFQVRGSSSAELIARIRKLLWPGEEVASQEVIRIDDLTLNLATYQAHVGNEPVEFTYLEYALFMFLVTHPNRVYSREVLLRRVWGSDYYGGSRTVDVHVRRIRAKLGGEIARRLETVRNVGYLWKS